MPRRRHRMRPVGGHGRDCSTPAASSNPPTSHRFGVDLTPVAASSWHRRRAKQEATMPYDRISELPDSVRDNVPKHAQEIYKEAFNSAWDEYKDADDRRGDASRETGRASCRERGWQYV